MNKARSSLLVATALLGLGFVACGGSSYSNPTTPGGTPTPTPAPTPTPSMSSMDDITGYTFGPLTVAVGTAVTWKNDDSVPHTASADTGDAFMFNTGTINPGATSAPIVFSQAGTFTYHCAVHPYMHGTIIVQ